MGLTKREALNQLSGPNSISNQQSLVKKIEGIGKNKVIKRVIPGGKTLTDTLDQQRLPSAVYNWLRGVRHWTFARISLSNNLEARKTTRSRVVDFDTNQKNYEWEVRGKRWLAERIAEVLGTDNIVAIEIDKDGIHTLIDAGKDFSPTSEDWEPYIELTPFKPPTF